MMVVYNSKTGFTKRYADWIAEELHCEAVSYKDFAKTPANADGMIIFGSLVHAGRIGHLDKMKSRMNNNLIIFAVGATPASAESVIRKIWTDNLTETELNAIPHFYMPGGLDYAKMGFADRTIMKMVAKMMKGKQGKTEDETAFGQAIQHSYDISSKEFIAPLVNFIQGKGGAETGL